MLYQKLLTGDKPYFLNIGNRIHGFEEHNHPELEFSCCLDGEFDIDIDKRKYHQKSGEMAIVGSMVAHGIPFGQTYGGTALTIEVGPTLLMGFFEPFAKAHFAEPVIKLDEHPELYSIIRSLAELHGSHTPSSQLAIRGELYRMCAYVLDNFVLNGAQRRDLKAQDDAQRIETALGLIHNSYAEPLSVEYVASKCGYSDSNFCKIFKQITGNTFHAALNRRRCEIACTLLESTAATVETIAGQSGFADSKSFCRVFGKCVGMSPGRYRKMRNDK